MTNYFNIVALFKTFEKAEQGMAACAEITKAARNKGEMHIAAAGVCNYDLLDAVNEAGVAYLVISDQFVPDAHIADLVSPFVEDGWVAREGIFETDEMEF